MIKYPARMVYLAGSWTFISLQFGRLYCQVWISSSELFFHYHVILSIVMSGVNTQLGVGYSQSCSIIEYTDIMIEYHARFEYPAGSWTFITMQHYRISCNVCISSWELFIRYHAVWSNILPGSNYQLGVGNTLSGRLIEYPARFEYPAVRWWLHISSTQNRYIQFQFLLI